MSVRVRHVSGVRVPVTLVEGVDHDAAAGHLGRALRDGTAFDSASALVVDLSLVPDISSDTLRTLDEASRAWERRRRWLAVSGAATYLSDDLLVGHRYITSRSAVSGAQRFFRLVAGYSGGRDRAVALLSAMLGIVECLGEAVVSTACRAMAVPARVVNVAGQVTRGR